eukprot:11494451-Alexandrium_andersonii.AAC.1
MQAIGRLPEPGQEVGQEVPPDRLDDKERVHRSLNAPGLEVVVVKPLLMPVGVDRAFHPPGRREAAIELPQ